MGWHERNHHGCRDCSLHLHTTHLRMSTWWMKQSNVLNSFRDRSSFIQCLWLWGIYWKRQLNSIAASARATLCTCCLDQREKTKWLLSWFIVTLLHHKCIHSHTVVLVRVQGVEYVQWLYFLLSDTIFKNAFCVKYLFFTVSFFKNHLTKKKWMLSCLKR